MILAYNGYMVGGTTDPCQTDAFRRLAGVFAVTQQSKTIEQ